LQNQFRYVILFKYIIILNLFAFGEGIFSEAEHFDFRFFMAVPKKRTTKSHQLKRRQHIFLKKPNLVKCPKCGYLISPHTICPFCGYYKGREIVDVLGKLDKKERKKREKEMKVKEKAEKKTLSMEELSRK